MNATQQSPQQDLAKRGLIQRFGLAGVYWSLFFAGALAFFVAGSLAVYQGDWRRYLVLLGLSLGWTFILLIGVRAGYRGQDPGKALGRITVLFLLLNMTNALATLSFI
jgi:hypothetical protein